MARCLVLLFILCAAPAVAQVDQARAEVYFNEARALCERDGGRLWGVSLCGPVVIADAATRTIAASEPPPAAARPPALGFANAAVEWGGRRWTTLVWQMIPPADAHLRGRLLIHELFHRIQPQLGFVSRDGQNEHLDTLDGRVWMRLEWRALARALASGPERTAAIGDAAAFRAKRRALVDGAAENERLLEMNEGLAQYTGTVLSAESAGEAIADAIAQLREAEQSPSFVRTFAYPSGAAYGLLLDSSSPGWTRRLKPSDDFGQLLLASARVPITNDVDAAAARYDVAALRAVEERREAERVARVADLRRRFVDGPVLVLPGANGSFATAGVTPIPGAGTVYPSVRVTAEWGSLEAALALRSPDRGTLTVPAPASIDGRPLRGEGWTLTLAEGWTVEAGRRPGDWRVVRMGR